MIDSARPAKCGMGSKFNNIYSSFQVPVTMAACGGRLCNDEEFCDSVLKDCVLCESVCTNRYDTYCKNLCPGMLHIKSCTL